MKDNKFNRVGIFMYRELEDNNYEFCIDIPMKFTKKYQKEFEEYLSDIFGENAQFEGSGYENVSYRKFFAKKIK